MTINIIDKSFKDKFIRAYFETMLWAETDDNNEPLDSNHDYFELPFCTYLKGAKDCLKFIKDNYENLSKLEYNGAEYCNSDLAGHDFYLTRCGHGVGFWDRGLGALGDKLTESAKQFGEVCPYVGDDGLIYTA